MDSKIFKFTRGFQLVLILLGKRQNDLPVIFCWSTFGLIFVSEKTCNNYFLPEANAETVL